MTIEEILNGPIAERSHSEARKGVLMTEAEVRGIIATMERETKSKAARRRMAEMGAKNIAGRISEEGCALYKAYAEALK